LARIFNFLTVSLNCGCSEFRTPKFLSNHRTLLPKFSLHTSTLRLLEGTSMSKGMVLTMRKPLPV